MAGTAGIVLGALGLLEIHPLVMAEVAVVVLGGGIAWASGLFANASRSIFSMFPAGKRATFSGFAITSVLGLVAVAFGALALAGVVPMKLLSIGLIVLGLSLMTGFIAVAQFDQVLPASSLGGRREGRGAPGLNILCGVVAALLGILAWMGVIPHLLTLVADIFVGIALLNIGYSISRRTFPRSAPRNKG